MFDSAGGNIPAGATQILLPTDGIYAANNAKVKARFPDATYQTYTAVGQVPGEWIDTEPGCVWPVPAAVALWHRWKGNGVTKGFYCSTGTRPEIQALLVAGDVPEWFEADPTQNPHIRAGDAETQWGWFGSYDETETPDTPAPSPTPQPTEDWFTMATEQDLVTAVRSVLNEGTAIGQVDWANTEKAILGTAQTLFNDINALKAAVATIPAAIVDALREAGLPMSPPPAANGTPAASA